MTPWTAAGDGVVPSIGTIAAHDATLVPIHGPDDLLPEYVGTPIGTLLNHHNLGHRAAPPAEPQMVVATCMDHRIRLNMPEGFAFVIRTAGATVEPLLFNIGAALSLRDVRAVAIIGHSDCAMVDVDRHRERFVATVPRLGPLTEDEATALFDAGASSFGIDDAIVQTLEQCESVHRLFPRVLISPLFFDVQDGMLSQIVRKGVGS